MDNLDHAALAHAPLTREAVRDVVSCAESGRMHNAILVDCVRRLAASHERLRMELEGLAAIASLDEQEEGT